MKKILSILFLLFWGFLALAQIDTSKYLIFRDTILVVDTLIRNDTTFIIKKYKIQVRLVEKKKEKDTLPPPYYDIDVGFLSPNYLKTKKKKQYDFSVWSSVSWFKICNKENTEFLSPRFGQEFDIYLSLENKKFWSFTSGVKYSIYREKLNISKNFVIIDSTQQMQIFENSHFIVDTIWYLDLDSLVEGDTVWRPIYDTTVVTTYDTVRYTIYDTTEKVLDIKSKNVYQRLEIPLIFSAKLKYGNFILNPQIGFIPSFLIKVNGKFFHNNQIIDIQDIIDFNRTIFWAYLSLNLPLKISKKIFLDLGIYSKIGLTPFYYTENFSTKFYTFGLKVSVKIFDYEI